MPVPTLPIELSFCDYQYHLRTMQSSDVERIISIEQVSHSHPWNEKNFQSSIASGHQCWLLEKQHIIVAYAITSTAADEAELLNITVAPDYQRQGLGSLLLNTLSDVFESSIHTLFLEVRVSNSAAIALYHSLDFNEVGIRPNYYPSSQGREDALIMALALGL